MKREPIPDPRRLGEVGRAVVDELHEMRITGARFYKTKHAIVEFEVGGSPVVMHFACTPRNASQSAKQAVCRLRKLIGQALGVRA